MPPEISAALLGFTALLLGGGLLQSATAPEASAANDDPNSYTVVVNKKHPLSPETYYPGDLVSVYGGQLRAEAAAKLNEMFSQASAAGVQLTVLSSFRSYETQVGTYGHWVSQYGQAQADTVSARPGYSEHQSGLAADIGAAGGECNLNQCFAQTGQGQWLAANAPRFGFIIRYPAGAEAITGYSYEPWHIRYVGADAGAIAGSTMEQYYGVEGGDYGQARKEPAKKTAPEPAAQGAKVVEISLYHWGAGRDGNDVPAAHIKPFPK